MNRRGFINGVGAVATAAMFPEPPMTFRGVPIVWDSLTNDGQVMALRGFTAEQLNFAGRAAFDFYQKPDLIVVSKTFKKLFDEAVS